MRHIPETLGTKYIRLKDCKNEHDDEEEDVGCHNCNLINALLRFYTQVQSI